MNKTELKARLIELGGEPLKGATVVELGVAIEKAELALLTPGARKARHLAAYKPNYFPTKSAVGNSSLHNGDPLAMTLAESSPEEVMEVAEVIAGLKKGELAARYVKLNNGAKRMNAGNIIRARVKSEVVTVDEVATVLAAI